MDDEERAVGGARFSRVSEPARETVPEPVDAGDNGMDLQYPTAK
ncbi:hypothetical protein [Natrialba asiatica]|nr:hypothetical protein [Natrialba asiatica]